MNFSLCLFRIEDNRQPEFFPASPGKEFEAEVKELNKSPQRRPVLIILRRDALTSYVYYLSVGGGGVGMVMSVNSGCYRELYWPCLYFNDALEGIMARNGELIAYSRFAPNIVLTDKTLRDCADHCESVVDFLHHSLESRSDLIEGAAPLSPNPPDPKGTVVCDSKIPPLTDGQIALRRLRIMLPVWVNTAREKLDDAHKIIVETNNRCTAALRMKKRTKRVAWLTVCLLVVICAGLTVGLNQKSRISGQKARIDRLKEERIEYIDAIDDLNETVEMLDDSIGDLLSQIDDRERTISALTEENESLKNESESLRLQLLNYRNRRGWK